MSSTSIDRWLIRVAAIVAGAVLLGLTPSDASAQPTYTITDLGTLGGFNSIAYGIDQSGVVVGSSFLSGFWGQRAFVYSGGSMSALPTLGGSYGIALGNAPSLPLRVVGQSAISGELTHAFLYADGTLTDLGTLGGSTSVALAINSAGQVIGDSKLAGDSLTHGFLWSNGAMVDLGTLGGPNSQALGINSAGDIVGFSVRADFQYRAFLYRGGTMTELAGLPDNDSWANAINDQGQITGYLRVSQYQIDAFLYESGVVTDIGTLGGSSGEGRAINNRGEIVGHAFNSTLSDRAFLYRDGQMIDLNTVIPQDSGWTVLKNATGINEAGQIVGWGITNDGFQHGFLLTPVTTGVASSFYTLPPCRVADTRDPNGPLGGPALSAGETRAWTIAGACQIPAGVRAVAVNLTVTQPTSPGYLTVFPSDVTRPLASTINFRAGATRANNGIFAASSSGRVSVFAGLPGGTTHAILDVVGYFE